MNRTEKSEVVDVLKDLFATAEAIVLADASGIDVNTINTLRSKCRAEGVEFRVVKNTLARLALQGTEKESLGASFVGPTAVALKPGDPVTPAKLLIDFADDINKFDVKGGFLSGSLLDKEGVKSLSKMKGKNELRAELLSVFKAPQTRFVGVCTTMVSQFVGLLQARADKLEEAA